MSEALEWGRSAFWVRLLHFHGNAVYLTDFHGLRETARKNSVIPDWDETYLDVRGD